MAKLQDINLLDVGHSIQMAGAVYAGNGKLYLAMFPEERGEAHVTRYGPETRVIQYTDQNDNTSDLEVLDMSQDDWATFLRQTDLLEVEVLTKSSDGVLAKAIVRKSQRQIEQGVSWKVFRRDGYRCRYCANDDVPLTVDHLVLWEEGGPSTVENLVSACRRCNKTRGNLPYEAWLGHSFYLKVSKALDGATKAANLKLVETLPGIPRLLHKRSRG